MVSRLGRCVQPKLDKGIASLPKFCAAYSLSHYLQLQVKGKEMLAHQVFLVHLSMMFVNGDISFDQNESVETVAPCALPKYTATCRA